MSFKTIAATLAALFAGAAAAQEVKLPATLTVTAYETGSNGFNSVGCELRLWDRRTLKQVR